MIPNLPRALSFSVDGDLCVPLQTCLQKRTSFSHVEKGEGSALFVKRGSAITLIAKVLNRNS